MKNKLSPKQALKSLLPKVNEHYKSNGLTCFAEWSPVYLKSSAGFKLVMDEKQESLMYIHDKPNKEQEEFILTWRKVVREVDEMLSELFEVHWTPGENFRTLILK